MNREKAPLPLRGILVLAGTAALSLTSLGDTPPEELTSSGVSGFDLYNIGSLGGPAIVTWSGPGVCSGEFPRFASVGAIHGGLAPGDDPAARVTIANDCAILDGFGGSAVRDNTYVYYFSERILRQKPLGAVPADPHTTVSMPITTPILPSNQRASVLTMAGGSIYWGHYNTSTGSLGLYRVNPVDGTTRHLRSISGAGSDIRKIRKYGFGPIIGSDGGLAILLNNGHLWRLNLDNNQLTRVATGVTDFVTHSVVTLAPLYTTYIYASRGTLSANPAPATPPGSVIRIPGASGSATTIYTASGVSNNNQILSIAVDPGISNPTSGHNLYITEAPIDCFGLLCVLGNHVIRRSTTANLAGTSVNFTTILNDNGGTNLVSDGHFLYYLYNSGIRRICSDAEPVNFNFAALNVEVTQCVQNLNHGAVLVSNREGTIVRGYATVTADNTGAGPYYPFAILEANVNGTPLPGSPFYPTNNTEISDEGSLANLRPERDLSFVFELPPLPAGQLNLRFCINPNQNPAETDNLANNDFSRTVSILPGRKVCLVAVPMRTGIGAYNPSHWGFPAIMQRATALLPVAQLELRCWQVLTDDHSDILHGDPFFPNGENDDEEDHDGDCLDAVECLRESSSFPGGCYTANWHGLIKFDIDKFAGLGRNPGRAGISEMIYNNSNFDHPIGGRIIAHELSHNFGRKHIDCSTGNPPKDPDDNYPYNPCTIGTGSPAGNYGYDAITGTVILPGAQGDLMSYDNPRWPSDYTWNGVFTYLTLAGGGAGAPPKGLPASNVLFVTGSLPAGSRSVALGRCWVRPAGDWNSANVQAAYAESSLLDDDPDALRIRTLDRNRSLLGSTPIPLEEPTDPGLTRFTHFVPFPAGTRFVQAMRGGLVVGEKLVSAHPPTVRIQRVAVDPANGVVELEWEASDPDGDPLSFMVQYSHDSGTTWFTYRIGYRGLDLVLDLAGLAGSPQALFRVVASDGLLTGSDTSLPVNIPRKAPLACIGGVQEGERIPFGSPRTLSGISIDPEDGSEGVALTWGGTLPPSTGRTVKLDRLPPGPHQAVLTALDRDGMMGSKTLHFEILPPVIPEASATPRLDGMCADAAYREATMIRVENAGSPHYVRLLHRGTSLYLAFTNMPYPGGLTRLPKSAGIYFDLNRNGAADVGDIGFSINQDGVPVILTGGRGGMQPDNTPPYGAQMMVTRGDKAWCAEMRIPDSLLGGWDQSVPVLLEAGGAKWPAGADLADPGTWTPVALRSVLPALANQPPVASAGADDALAIQGPFFYALNGDQSFDPDGDPITYSWSQLEGPPVSFSSTTEQNPGFTIGPPSLPTTYRFSLTVNDGTVDSAPDEVVLMVYPTVTQQPSLVDLFSLSDDGLHGRFANLAPDTSYLLQRSRTLDDDWVTIDRVTADQFGAINFFELIDPGTPSCFYRIAEP